MNKPISVAIKETRQGICDVINASGLPISVIELIMSDVYGEVQNRRITGDSGGFN